MMCACVLIGQKQSCRAYRARVHNPGTSFHLNLQTENRLKPDSQTIRADRTITRYTKIVRRGTHRKKRNDKTLVYTVTLPINRSDKVRKNIARPLRTGFQWDFVVLANREIMTGEIMQTFFLLVNWKRGEKTSVYHMSK